MVSFRRALFNAACMFFISMVDVGSEAKSLARLMSSTNLQAMQSVFMRSEQAHTQSMARISQRMSHADAMKVLQKQNRTNVALLQLAGQKSLRTNKKGIDGAKKLLNDMIYESMSKYDLEIAKCTAYYAEQCGEMEACRGKIAAANYVAANSRALILDSQSNIAKCEDDIPETKLELKQHELKCKHELGKMNARLKILLGDIAVLTTILEMTDCDKKFLQTDALSILNCHDTCGRHFVTFNHDQMRKKLSQLQSTVGQKLMKDGFKDLFNDLESLETVDFLQVIQKSKKRGESDDLPGNKTDFNNPPLPRTEVPANPCTDPDAGAPSQNDKNSAKCSITGSPMCYKLQERFLNIQAGIKDEKDELQDDIEMLENYCDETKTNLENQIASDMGILAESQTKLAAATEKEATAAETARQTASYHNSLDADLKKNMKSCSDNYINFETELCALKKIRGELYKMKSSGTGGAVFQDCEVSKWKPDECSKPCGKGGTQLISRTVLTHANGGSKRLPLQAERSCNLHPCPVDCELSEWSGWSKCSAECGGGVQQRLREVKVPMRNEGEPCGESSETRPCNGQSCEADCELTDWTKWSKCSKECDGGTKKRTKFVKEAAQGEGECPDMWSPKRLEYEQCGMQRCKVEAGKPLECHSSFDVILLIDGSGSLGKKGWNAEIKAAQTFIDAFSSPDAETNMAVILYSGPKTWGGVRKCFAKNPAVPVDMEKTCGIKTVTHFTQDLNKVKQLVTGLDWPEGSTLTSLALMTAKSELSVGRGDAKSVVVVITDGRPLSYRATWVASHLLRKQARLVWVPVTKYAPLKFIKKCATRRWQENVVLVESFAELEKPDVVTHLVANICPKEDPEVVEFVAK